MERFTESQTWYIIFDTSNTGLKWWHFFLHPKFRHVHLLRENRGQTLMINSLSHIMCVREYANSITNIIQQEIAQKPTAILQYTVHYASHYKINYLEPLTCVSVAKRILGIRSRLITPKSLYHELIKAGAVPILPYCIT